MYRVLANNVCIYNDAFALPETRAVAPKLVMEDSAAGSLSITLPVENAGYDLIERLTTDISVERSGDIIWTGRVINDRKDFWKNRVLTCEGELAFFNDSTQPPHEYKNITVREYMSKLLTIHNSRVSANRRFTLGAVTMNDADFPTYYTNNEKTIELLNALKTRLGGHFRVRHENGVRYLDYLKDCAKAATQTIQFGRNLIEFTRNWDSTEYATAILPLGARLDDSPIEALDAYLTVESVNSGATHVQNASAVAAYGWIEKVVRWDDVTDPAQLLAKAKRYLTDLQFDNMQIEVSALDMHYLDKTAQPVELLDEIRVISRPHGLDRFFPVTKLEIPLDEPEKATFKLGDTVQTPLTKVNNEVSAKIMQTIENLPKAHTLLKTAKENATEIMNMATTGYITILKDQYGSESLTITPRRVAKESDLKSLSQYWIWKMNGLAYYGTYPGEEWKGPQLKTAITMDGAIVADFITAGTMSADRIRGGVIVSSDANENLKFDLTTGTLTMKKGSIDIGNGTFKVDTQGNVTMKKGSINIGNGNFKVDTDGTMYAGSNATFAGKLSAATGTFAGALQAATGNFKGSIDVGTGAFKVDDKGNVTITKGSIDINSGAFKVDTSGNMTMTKGSIDIASGAFKVDKYGNMTMTKGSIDIASGAFKVDSYGNVTMTKGSININSGAFKVDSYGNVTMTCGSINIGNGNFKVGTDGTMYAGSNATFKGTVQAYKFLSTSGSDMQTSDGKWKPDYLELKGLKIVKSNGYWGGETTFQIDNSGNVTMKGNITMDSGSSINWSGVTNYNIESNPAYSLASTANENAGDASTAAAAAKVTADAAYANMCSDEKVFNILTGGTKCGIFSYESSWGGTRLYINASYIKSGTIAADFVSLACNSGGFCKGYGSDGKQTTYGAMMYGSNGAGREPYFLVTNLGCRMSAGAFLYVVSDGIHASSEIKTGSDRRLKNSISYTMDQYDEFFMNLKPARFKYNREHGSGLHTGFIAQDVEEALFAAGLTRSDLEALTIEHVEDPSEGLSAERYSLRYGEFVALNTHMIQKLYRMVEALMRKETL